MKSSDPNKSNWVTVNEKCLHCCHCHCCIHKYSLYCCRPGLALFYQPPKSFAGPAEVPPWTLPPLWSGHVHHHIPQTLSSSRHHAGRSAPQVRITLPILASTLTIDLWKLHNNFPQLKILFSIFKWITFNQKWSFFFSLWSLLPTPKGVLWVLWPTAAPVAAYRPLTSRDDAVAQDLLSWFPEGGRGHNVI